MFLSVRNVLYDAVVLYALDTKHVIADVLTIGEYTALLWCSTVLNDKWSGGFALLDHFCRLQPLVSITASTSSFQSSTAPALLRNMYFTRNHANVRKQHVYIWNIFWNKNRCPIMNPQNAGLLSYENPVCDLATARQRGDKGRYIGFHCWARTIESPSAYPASAESDRLSVWHSADKQEACVAIFVIPFFVDKDVNTVFQGSLLVRFTVQPELEITVIIPVATSAINKLLPITVQRNFWL